MNESLLAFERIVRSTSAISTTIQDNDIGSTTGAHPFDERNIHSDISKVSKNLFDDGHYAQATFEAFKVIENTIKRLSALSESGHKLMMTAFAEAAPRIMLTSLSNQSEKDEQMGYKFIFAGSISAIRNPRGHDHLIDSIDLCLDHLSIASVLMRRLENRVK
jgi:uncharacterized protein (TIGR02391 family)